MKLDTLFNLHITTCTKNTGSFQLYDSDHDGYITRQEMEVIVDSIHKMVGQMVEFPDEEDTPQKRVHKMFEDMDSVGKMIYVKK